MTNPEQSNNAKNQFLYPRSSYHGEFTPQHLAFNANLQEFAQRIEVICALETNGKISPDDAYEQIQQLYQRLKESKKGLGIGEKPPETPAWSFMSDGKSLAEEEIWMNKICIKKG